jgi:hypothetical protein
MASATPESISEVLSLQLRATDAGGVADEIGRTWQAFEAALTPILGKRGVAALYQRSLHRARASHPWLCDPDETIPATIDLAALQAAIAGRDRESAAAGGRAFLQAFHDLLASLVGPSLTGRLLRPGWARPVRDTPAEDPAP